MKSFILTLVLLSAFACPLRAQEVALEPIIVTPYRTPVARSNSAHDVESLQAEDLSGQGIYQAQDALNETAGIIVAGSGQGGDTSVFLRGHNSYHTRFMLDGIRLYDPLLTTAYYSLTHFNLNGLESIEISKGPQSSLYGSDAIAGVVNFLSKRGEGKPHFDYTQAFGTYQTFQERLDFSGETANGLGYYLSVDRLDKEGFSAAKESNGNSETDPYHNTNSSLRLDYAFSDDTQAGLIYRNIYAKYEFDAWDYFSSPSLPTDDDNNIGRNFENIAGINLKNRLNERTTLKILTGLTTLYRTTWEEANTDSWYSSKTYQSDIQLEADLLDNYKVLTGFDYIREKGDSFRSDGIYGVSDFPKETANNKGYFIENILSPLPGNQLSFTLRQDDHSSFGTQDTFRVGVSQLIKETNTKLRLLYGEGFKAPSLYQLYAPATGWGSQIGNIDLKPEESSTYEAGIEQEINKYLSTDLAYFESNFKNLIDFDNTAGYLNVSKARITGIETGINFKPGKELNIKLNYAWLDTENRQDNSELLRRPKNKVSLQAEYSPIEKLSLGLSAIYTGHRPDTGGVLLKSYTILNAYSSYKPNENAELFARLVNLLNQDYEEVSGYQTEKFSVLAGFKLRF